jgi:hypothetical protein
VGGVQPRHPGVTSASTRVTDPPLALPMSLDGSQLPHRNRIGGRGKRGVTGGTRAEMGDAAPIRGLGTNTSGDAAPDRGTPPRFGGRGINTSGDDTPQRGRETDHVPVCISCLPVGYPQARSTISGLGNGGLQGLRG